jgi:alpha-tubulin suppressor-like RCC1 family protein
LTLCAYMEDGGKNTEHTGEDWSQEDEKGEAKKKFSVWKEVFIAAPEKANVVSWGLRTSLGPSLIYENIINSFGEVSVEAVDRRTHDAAYQVPLPINELEKWGTMSGAASTSSVVCLLLDDGKLVAFREEAKKEPSIERMPIQRRVLHISAGIAHFAASILSPKGLSNILVWGQNNCGQLGLGHAKDSLAPVTIRKLAVVTVAKVFCGDYCTFALCGNGECYSWGKNTFGQLGIGNNGSRKGESDQHKDTEKTLSTQHGEHVLSPTKVNPYLVRASNGSTGELMPADNFVVDIEKSNRNTIDGANQSISDHHSFFAFNKEYIERISADGSNHATSWKVPYDYSKKMRLNSKQINNFQDLLAEKIKMQKALADIERKIIDKRMCGVTSSDIHDRLQPSRQSEETKLLFSLNSDQDYTKAKDLVSAYILEKNHLRLEIQRLYIGIQPLEELAKTESKKIKSNSSVIVGLENEINAIEVDVDDCYDIVKRRVMESSLRQKKEALKSRKRFQEATAIKMGTVQLQIEETKSKIRKNKLKMNTIEQQVRMCEKMINAHVTCLKRKISLHHGSRISIMVKKMNTIVEKARDTEVRSLSSNLDVLTALKEKYNIPPGLSHILDLSNERLRALLEDFKLDINNSSFGDQDPIRDVSQNIVKLVTQNIEKRLKLNEFLSGLLVNLENSGHSMYPPEARVS